MYTNNTQYTLYTSHHQLHTYSALKNALMFLKLIALYNKIAYDERKKFNLYLLADNVMNGRGYEFLLKLILHFLYMVNMH